MKPQVLALVAAIALIAWNAAFGFGIRGSVIGNGGRSAPPGSNGVYRLYGTVGLPGVDPAHRAGSRVCSGFWCFAGPQVLAVDPAGGAGAPLEFAFGPAMPNPTRDQTRFELALPAAAQVRLSVYDVAGRQVGDAASHRLEAGRHTLAWRTSEVHAGVYFVRLVTDGTIRAKRTVVVVR